MPSTATSPDLRDVPLRERPLVPCLLMLYAAVWAWAAVGPPDRAEWWLEQLLPAGWLLFLALAWRPRLVRLSDASCAALAVFLALHAAGARYGYEAAPAGAWLADQLGTGFGAGAFGGPPRNPYDRVVHAAFGLCLGYVARELWLRAGGFGRHARLWASAHAGAAVLAASAAYEILEWSVARAFAPGVGSAFVGTQGDVWDAPADMAMAALGALLGLAGAEALHRVCARRRAALPAGSGVHQSVDAPRRHAARIRNSATG